jgi:hypothetical protein
VSVPDAPVSPKFHVYETSWNAVVLPLIELSVVPVASKNTRSGEIPVSRTALALSVRGPLVPEQDSPVGTTAGGGEAALTATVVDCWALPPAPVQVNV